MQAEPLKDRDCTIDTPVTLGRQDDPIYGKGIRIRPRIDGRKDTKHFESISRYPQQNWTH